MTYKEFFKRLAKISRKWRLIRSESWSKSDMIRSGKTCPVKAVAGKTGSDYPHDAGLKIGLAYDQVTYLVDAADGPFMRSGKRLRKQMLRAVGLA